MTHNNGTAINPAIFHPQAIVDPLDIGLWRVTVTQGRDRQVFDLIAATDDEAAMTALDMFEAARGV